MSESSLVFIKYGMKTNDYTYNKTCFNYNEYTSTGIHILVDVKPFIITYT